MTTSGKGRSGGRRNGDQASAHLGSDAPRTLKQQRNHLASEVVTLVRMREVSDRLWRLRDLNMGLQEIVEAGMAQLGADWANIQLLNPDEQKLEIVAQHGFDKNFLDHFRIVSSSDDSACGRSLRTGRRTVIEDVDTDVGFAPHRAIAAAVGYRAVQSTPLFGKDGEIIGMFSTHFRRPHRPSENNLRRFDLYAIQAAEFIERIRAEEQLNRLAGALLSSQEEENRSLARELHDEFSQELAALRMEVSSLAILSEGSLPLRQRIEEFGKKLGHLADEMHSMSRRLHPQILHELGLEVALREQCSNFFDQTGIPVRFTCDQLPASLPTGVSIGLYRIAQEALLNIRKHSGANVIQLNLECRNGAANLRVEDTGDGFDLAEARRKGGLGIVSMEERARLMNGKFQIRSTPGEGTVVEVIVPLSDARS